VSLGERAVDLINDYGAVKIALASPDDIRRWSSGEVMNPRAINYRTCQPERDGLYCERIFGPEKDWECACGNIRGIEFDGVICDRCGVTVTDSRVRFRRFGHIELAAPVVHAWFFRGKPSLLGTLLNVSARFLKRVIYFEDYAVIDPGGTPLQKRQLLSEDEFRTAKEQYKRDGKLGESFQADIGARAISKLLMRLDLAALAERLRLRLAKTSRTYEIEGVSRRLKVVEALLESGVRPEWMVLDCIPVIPPGLRPLKVLRSGNFELCEMLELYKMVIDRSRRLKRLFEINAPERIIRNDQRALQNSVDQLFDNKRCKRPMVGTSNRPMNSLTGMIKGKHGRLRENLVRKRVDFSASSVTVVDPNLKLHQCGLPRRIALELFQPFIIRRMMELRHTEAITSCKEKLEPRARDVWGVLDEIIRNHPVLLHRAPIWHRIGMQAFEPTLVDSNAIHIHPLVCKGLNAGSGGDRMVVHLPLSIEARVEAMTLMMSTNNLLSPTNGKPIVNPIQDIALGIHSVTVSRPGEQGEGMIFASSNEVILAHGQGKVGVHARIKLRLPAQKRLRGDGEKTLTSPAIIETTVGRVVFNDILAARLPFYNLVLSQAQLRSVIADCDQMMGRRETIALLDRMKELGFRELTRSGSSVAIDDLTMTPLRDSIIAPTGNIPTLIKANFRKGLSMLEYFGTAHGVRRGRFEKAVRTTRSRELAWKLADATQNVVIGVEDCGTCKGITKSLINKREKVEVSLLRSVRGRVSRVNIVDPNSEEIVVKENEIITPAAARKLEEIGIDTIQVRSPLSCEAFRGVCRLCYGMDLASGQMVELGTAAGIIAAQSIDETSNRLTVRALAREVGGTMEMADGLARVIELFEARRPHRPAFIAETDGRVELFDGKGLGKRVIIVRSDQGVDREYHVPRGKSLRVRNGDRVRAGDALVEGPVVLYDILRVSGEGAVHRYLLEELQDVYRRHGALIDDKHLEIIIARMLRMVRVTSIGDTGLLPGSLIDRVELRRVNQELTGRVKITDAGDTDLRAGDIVARDHLDQENLRARAAGNRNALCIQPKPAVAVTQLLGITKAARLCEGFISAASFNETTKVLTEAALGGKVDRLIGLKENVILGHLIPAGTGFKAYVDANVGIRQGALEGAS
jgi:DNA-directed RNA polymerase beta' subunit